MNLKNELPISPFGAHIGVEVVSYDIGFAHCSIQLQPFHKNNGGRVHGGVLTSLADTAAGVAVRTLRPEGKQSATTDLSISFIRPPQGETLQAMAKVIHAGRRLFRCEVEITSAEKLVAKTNATFMLV